MIRNRIKLMKLTCFAFAFAWVVHVIVSFSKYYNEELIYFDTKFFILSLLMFWVGILLSLIISGGFIFVFWSSYRTKYKEEQIFDFIPKKIIAFLIAISIFNFGFGISIFKPALFFTLVIFIRCLEKEPEVNKGI
jgi:hypothetical protein